MPRPIKVIAEEDAVFGMVLIAELAPSEREVDVRLTDEIDHQLETGPSTSSRGSAETGSCQVRAGILLICQSAVMSVNRARPTPPSIGFLRSGDRQPGLSPCWSARRTMARPARWS